MAFSHLGLSAKVLAAIKRPATKPPLQFRTRLFRTYSRVAMCWALHKPEPAKPPPSCCRCLRCWNKAAHARACRARSSSNRRRACRASRRSFRKIWQEPQAQCRTDHRRRFVRRPGRKAVTRRRCADRHAGPLARPFRARPAAPVGMRASDHRRSRPHARHGFHSRHRAHRQTGAVYPPNFVFHRDDATGNSAHRRHIPAQPGTRRSSKPATAATTITQLLVSTGRDPHEKRETLRRLIRSADSFKNAIIFCNRKREVAIFIVRCCATSSTRSPCTATWISPHAQRRSTGSAAAKSNAQLPRTLRRAASISRR